MNKIFKFSPRPSWFLWLLYFHSLAFVALTDGLVAYWSFDDCTARAKL